MSDVHSARVRSYNMSRIKSKNTKPELVIRKLLHSAGFRFRLHASDLPGKPDIVLKKYGTVVFVHGCFWHGHEHCRYFVVPKTRTKWWLNKINVNRANDREAMEKLQDAGWNVLVLWECELRKNTIEQTLEQVIQKIRANG